MIKDNVSKEFLNWIKNISQHITFKFYCITYTYSRKSRSFTCICNYGSKVTEDIYLSRRDQGKRDSAAAITGRLKRDYTDFVVKIICDENISEIEKNVIKDMKSEYVYDLIRSDDVFEEV